MITYGKPQPKKDGSLFLREIQKEIDNVVRPDGRKLMHHWRDVYRRYAVYRRGNHLFFVRAQMFCTGWRAFLDKKVGIKNVV